MANYMAEVAKLLGVEIGEEFEIQFPSPSDVKTTAVFADDGFRIVHTDAVILTPYWKESLLHSLLCGSLTIKHKPWKPNEKDNFWYISRIGTVEKKPYGGSVGHMNYYKIGNCYRTKAEAEANRDKWSRFYASDEVLEV